MKITITLGCLLFIFGYVNITYAQQQPLPEFRWVRPVGQDAEDIAVDQDGYVYTIGTLNDTFVYDNHQYTPAGFGDIYFAKHDALGNLVWFNQIKIPAGGAYTFFNSRQHGFPLSRLILRIAVDQKGNVIITGFFWKKADFDPGPDTNWVRGGLVGRFFVAKYDKYGTFTWVKSFSGGRGVYPTGLVLDWEGNIYVRGNFMGTVDFDPDSTTAFRSSQHIYGNAFLLKLDKNGRFKWVNTFDGAGGVFSHAPPLTHSDLAISEGIDNKQFLLTVGWLGVRSRNSSSDSFDLDPNPNHHAYLNTDSGISFIAKYKTNGDLVWAYNFGDTVNDRYSNQSLSVSLDNNNYIILTGSGMSYYNLNPNPSQSFYLPPNSTPNIAQPLFFIARLSPDANVLWGHRYCTDSFSIHSLPNPEGRLTFGHIATDNSGAIYATGFAHKRTNFAPGASSPVRFPQDEVSPYVLKVDDSGRLDFVTAVRGNTTTNQHLFKLNFGFKTAVDRYGNIYSVGLKSIPADFDPGPDSFIFNPNQYSKGASAGYIWKLNNNCPPMVDSATVTSCGAYHLGGRTFDSSGRYTVVLPRRANSCDSIIVLDLTVEHHNASFSRQGNTLVANSPQATGYQWLSCDGQGNKTPISGATGTTFQPTTDGRYAVVFIYPNCSDTTDCLTINNLGIEHSPIDKGLKIIPNPTQNQVQVIFDRSVHQAQLRLVNTLGKVVWKTDDFSGKVTSVDLRNLATGVYYLRVKTDAGMRVKKVVKW